MLGMGRRQLSIPNYISHDLTTPMPELGGEPFDVVVHSAAKVSPWGKRVDFVRNNVEATQHVLDYCIQHGLPKLIFISSPSVYYKAEHQLNLTEESPLPEKFFNAYAETKRAAELLVEQYPGEWAILRPRAVFGPGDTVLLPRLLLAARAGRLPLLIPRDGPVVGDLIYIENLTDAILKTATDPAITGTYNLTNNEPVAILEFLLDILKQLDFPIPQRRVSVGRAMAVAWAIEKFFSCFLPNREPLITRFGVHLFAYSKTFDVSKMLRDLGTPRVSVAEGVKETVAWVKGGGLSLSPN